MDLPPATSLNADPILVGLIVAVALGAVWLLRHAGPADRTATRWTALAGVIALLIVAWASPLATVAEHYLLSAHLVQITLVMGVIPPLLLIALPRDPRLSPPRFVVRGLRLVVHPALAIVAVNAAFFGWHMSAPYGAALSHWWLYDLQQLTLLMVSVAFWWPIITPFSPPVRAMTPLGKMGYILLATIPQTFGGLAVALAHHLLYAGYAAAPRILGIDLMSDQQIAGASIALLSKAALLTAFVIVFMRLLQAEPSEGGDEGGDGGGGSPRIVAPLPVPSGTPRWLSDLEAGRTVSEPAAVGPNRVREPAGSGSGRA
jgi:cytochrome c oxidase assembly factor CtaG